ncbi:MAG: hypothetical protein COA58_05300 [Bacteroidetes bacterium]|nr:MAG: hypothetical protein COA58_05300 [Bacteroidota bacterium]
MRILKILFILFLSFNGFCQNQLTSDVATEFVREKIYDLNLKIWNAVHSGEIKAYKNDSLVSVLGLKELDNQISLEFTKMIPNPDNPEDPYDLVPKIEVVRFDSSNQFKGVNLHFKKTISSGSINFQLVSIASVWQPVTASGIDLGINPMYHIKNEDLKKLLGNQYEFYEALFLIRASVGDFINPFYYPFKDANKLGNEITYYNMWHSQHYLHFSAYQDTIMGHHLASLPVSLAEKIVSTEMELYEDVKLTNAYSNIKSQLGDSAYVMVPNPDNPDDPYDLIARVVYLTFELESIKNVEVLMEKGNSLFRLSKHCSSLNGVEYDLSSCRRDIYYSFDETKKLLQPHDRIILETLMEDLTK